jgi:hypothetical protein
MRVIRTRTATGTPGGLRERCVEEAIVVLVIGKVCGVSSSWFVAVLCGFVPFWRALVKDLGLCRLLCKAMRVFHGGAVCAFSVEERVMCICVYMQVLLLVTSVC